MMTDDTRILEISDLPVPVAGRGYDHAPTHDHSHGGHGHGHSHAADGAAPAFRPPFSLMRMSVGGRLALALVLSAGVWAAVSWALAPING